eukprot:scaffold32404_cov77-Phaeocystis_antarctica.AAC.4
MVHVFEQAALSWHAEALNGLATTIGCATATTIAAARRQTIKEPHARLALQVSSYTLTSLRGARYEPSEATTCVLSVAHGLGVTRRPRKTCSAHTPPSFPCFHQPDRS